MWQIKKVAQHPLSLPLAICLLFFASFLSGCARPRPFPDLPKLNVESFLPAIRDQVAKAYAEAQANSKDAAANGRLGMVLQAYEQNQFAETCYQRARFLDPRSFVWAYYLGNVQAALGKPQDAAEALREAVRLDQNNLPARLKLADSLFAGGDRRRSQTLYGDLLKENAGLPQAHYGLGRIQEAQGDLNAAVESYRRACELYPGYAASHYALGLLYRRLGQAAPAQEHLAAYQKDPLAAPPLEDPLQAAVRRLNSGAQQHMTAGLRLEAAGRPEDAVAEHEKALEIDPKLTQAHTNLIVLYGRLGQPQKAGQHYRAAIALNPNAADAHYDFGVLLYGQGKYREAGEAFRKALAINPNYAEAHNNLAYVLEREGRPDEALQHYRAAIESKPNYRLARFHLGRLLLSRGRNQEAIEQLLQTLSPQDDQTPGFLYGLGAAYARTGNREKALQYIRSAREQALSFGQREILASIERDLQALERAH